jgi:hypothetical protein
LPRLTLNRNYSGPGKAWCYRLDPPSRIDPQVIPVPHPLLFLVSTSLKVDINMKNRTETLEVGSLAPDFSLGAANREGTFTLGFLLARGVLILEFLRGTW